MTARANSPARGARNRFGIFSVDLDRVRARWSPARGPPCDAHWSFDIARRDRGSSRPPLAPPGPFEVVRGRLSRPAHPPDPLKHIRDRLRRPLAAPRRPNAATVQRRGDLPKRLRPGGLGLANGGATLSAKASAPAVWFALEDKHGHNAQVSTGGRGHEAGMKISMNGPTSAPVRSSGAVQIDPLFGPLSRYDGLELNSESSFYPGECYLCA